MALHQIIYILLILLGLHCNKIETQTSIITDLSSTIPSEPIDRSVTTLEPTTTTTLGPTTTVKPTLGPSIEHSINEKSFLWTPKDDRSIEVTVDKGYLISAQVNIGFLDAANQDYIMIKSGNSLEDQSSSGRLFTYNLSETKNYLFNYDHVFGYYQSLNGDGDFSVLFERVGDVGSTTTTEMTTTVSWPPAQPGEKKSIEIHVGGYNYSNYSNNAVLNKLKTCIVDMAKNYCTTNNIIPESIEIQNVLFTKIRKCPVAWDIDEQCVEIVLELPIYYNSTIWQGYQLNAQHLMKMWKKFWKTCDHFEQLEPPDFDNIVMGWAIAISSVVAVLIVILCIIKFCSRRIRDLFNKKTDEDDTMSIISSKRESGVSMSNHYLQVTPQFFENDFALNDGD